jgi:hypothetical protein
MRSCAPDDEPAEELAMRRSSVITTIATTTSLVAAAAGDAEARLDLYIDKAVQQMSVIQNGRLLYVWPVSTTRDRSSTPSGVYTPERLERSWFSRAYYNSPMPHAIFFHGGYAIHGSDDMSRLGGPASHGCVRLSPGDAALLYSMVKHEGPENTVIFVSGDAGRQPLRYGNFDDPARPVLRRDDGIAHGPYPGSVLPPPGPGDPHVDGAGAYPPSGPPMMPPYPGRQVEGRGYPRGPDAIPYDAGERYGDRRGAPRGPGVPPDYAIDRYGDGRGVPRGFGPPDYGGGPRGPGGPPDYAVDPYGDGRGAPRLPPDHYADRRGGPPDLRLPPDYNGDHYADRRGGPPDLRLPSDYNGDRYADRRGVPPDLRLPPDYNGDHYADRRGVPPDLRLLPDHAVDPYGDGRGGPHGPNVAAPYPSPDRHDGPRSADPRGPRPPAYEPDGYVDGPEQRRGGQLTMRDDHPASHVPVPRPEGAAQEDRTPRNGLRQPAAAEKARPGRIPDQPTNWQGPGAQGAGVGRLGMPGSAVQALPPMPPAVPAPLPATASLPPSGSSPRLEPPADIGYKVLPKSYWSGASWRWRAKRDDDPQ